LREGLDHHGRVEAEAAGQCDRLGGGGDVDTSEELVDGLEGLTVTGPGPTMVSVEDRASRTGCPAASASSVAPTTMSRSPLPARMGPPLMGASISG
jgi:hypothetical protein